MTVRMIPGNIIDLMLSQNDVSASKQTRLRWNGARPRSAGYIQISAGSARCCFHGDLGKSL